MKYTLTIVQNIRDNTKGNNKENKPEEVQVQTLVRSSSVFKMEKPQTVMLKGSASTSRIGGNPRILKY